MKKSKSGLFLMEIMFSILFFAIGSAVCLQLFAKAHSLSRGASCLDEAVALCQSTAAILEEEPLTSLPGFYESSRLQNDSFEADIHTDAGELLLLVSQDETCYDISVLSKKDDSRLFSLQLLKKNAQSASSADTERTH